jgi:carboxyl-terminal processing protease
MKLKQVIASFLAAAMLMVPQVSLAEESYQSQAYESILSFIEQNYIDESVTKDDLAKKTVERLLKDNPTMLITFLKAAFAELDPYSEFYTREEFDMLINSLNESFYGIGVVIQKRGDYVEIIDCQEGSPAEKAGLKSGDKIYKVNGEDVTGWLIDNVREKLIGEDGSKVELTVLRDDAEYTTTAVRGKVQESTVNVQMLKGNIAYVQITSFSDKTDKEFKEALEELDQNGVTKILLDLRNNPGGYVETAIGVAKELVPKGVIVQTMYRHEEENETYFSELEETKYELAVLVNENTASSAEILASAIQDSGAGKLIGEQTYGKAVIQQVYTIPNGQAIKLTTGHYLTRNGSEINHIGIKPDEEVSNFKRQVDVSKYAKFDYKEKLTVGAQAESVRAAEERLSAMGYYVGEVDDVFTEDTAKAIEQFQAEHGLFAYGVLDITTQVKINNVFYDMSEIVDRQFERGYELLGGQIE